MSPKSGKNLASCSLQNREEMISAYVMGKLDEQKAQEFELHIVECEWCFHELQFQDDLKQVVNRMPAEGLADVRPLPWYKGIIPSGRAWLAAAAVLLVAVGIYSSTRLNVPQYFELARLTSNDRDGLRIQVRGDSAAASEDFAMAATALLAAERKHLGVWLYFDQTQAEQAISLLRAAYNKSTNALTRDECAYFLGKAFLMQANTDSACIWFNRVTAVYQDAAMNLTEKLNCSKSH
ncbi:MAG: hypothetical protein ILNGONEN_01690 [Syntrophorhabdaceae bacterium]|nr:hypothetical protein [Syntrophorhabdaceae bacterium]